MKPHYAYLLGLVAGAFISCAPAQGQNLDYVHLRSGELLKGTILGEDRQRYRFLPSRDCPVSWSLIPRDAVKYVVYADAKKADQVLGLSQARDLCSSNEKTLIRFLPAEAFGETITAGVAGATQSVWVAAYYLSDSRAPSIRKFYEALRAKAQAGLDIVVIAEFGAGTQATMRNDSLNFAQDLARDKIKTFFVQGARVQHKKLVIVDGRRVFLGSSNLTAAGVSRSDEMNIEVENEDFAAKAIADFVRLRSVAKPAKELRY